MENSEKNEFLPDPTSPLLIVVSGPSGSGKDSVLNQMKEMNLPLHFVVTATTRPMREGEVEGKDYFFVSEARFLEMIQHDELLEWAHVYNDYKGIPKWQIRQAFASRLDVIMRLDVQGAATIRRMHPQALLIFLTVDSQEEMEARLQARRTESPESLKLRVITALQEMKRIPEFDYVVPNHNDQLNQTVETILAIIRAEHHRSKPRQIQV